MRRILPLILLLVLAPMPALADALVVKESAHSVKETLDRLAKSLDEKGIKVVARVDHAAGAKAVGMELRPTELILFGNPRLGTPLMQANPQAGIDLPMKALAWQDAAGKVWIGYTSPDALKSRYGLKDRDEPLKAMGQALEGLVGAAAGK